VIPEWVLVFVALVLGLVVRGAAGAAWAGSRAAGYWRERDRW
jgi:hypothetical protein